MLRETDLPCSDCGSELVERTVDAQELSASLSSDDTIQLAKCPDCGARYSPEPTLSRLNNTPDENQIEGEVDTP